MAYRGPKLAAIFDDALTRKAAREIARDIGAELTEQTKRHTPVGATGELRNSIERVPVERIPDGYRSGAQTEKWYAPIVEHGAAPHEIGAKKAEALGVGEDAFAKVQHSGFAGAHMFLKGAADMDAHLEQIAEPALNRMRAEFEANAKRQRNR